MLRVPKGPFRIVAVGLEKGLVVSFAGLLKQLGELPELGRVDHASISCAHVKEVKPLTRTLTMTLALTLTPALTLTLALLLAGGRDGLGLVLTGQDLIVRQ